MVHVHVYVKQQEDDYSHYRSSNRYMYGIAILKYFVNGYI